LALIVESSLLIIILVESYLGNQNFPSISIIPYAEPQCRSLSATIIATGRSNSTGAYQNRTVEFSCSGNYALKIFPLDTLTCFFVPWPSILPPRTHLHPSSRVSNALAYLPGQLFGGSNDPSQEWKYSLPEFLGRLRLHCSP